MSLGSKEGPDMEVPGPVELTSVLGVICIGGWNRYLGGRGRPDGHTW